MKVLQVNCVYKEGSTGKIVYDLHNTLKNKGIESIVCYGRGKKICEPFVYKTSSEFLGKFNNLKSRFTGIQYNGSFLATSKLKNIIKKEKPDIVHLQCINGFFMNIYKIISFLKYNKINTVITLHAEFMYTGNCGHSYDCYKWKSGCGNCPQLKEATNSYFFDKTHIAWLKMKQAFDDFNRLKIVSVSPWLKERASSSPILSDKKHYTVLNGIDTVNIFKPSNYSDIKKKLGLSNEKIILHVTSNFESDIKGGKYIKLLSENINRDDIKIIIIGNKKKGLNLPKNIIDIGRIEDQKELSKYYSLANLTIITSKRETFSMICAESLACGTPVVGFKAGGPELISLNKYSEFVEYGDMNSLIDITNKWIDFKSNNLSEILNNSNEYYSKEKMCDDYIRIYNGFINYNGKGVN